MAWIITRDLVDSDDPELCAAGIRSRGYEGDGADLPTRFRLLDDDGEVYYEGRYDGVDGDSIAAFAPLDDFGRGYAGCTELHYWQSGNGGGWKRL